MFKKIIVISTMASAVLFVAAPALAQFEFGLDATAKKAQYGTTDVYGIISSTISIVLSVVGLVFLAIMFYAGLRWMTARGNEEYISKAKEAMFGALIGFILVVISYGASAFIFKALTK